MKKKILIAALSAITTVGIANAASAATVPVSSPQTARICKTITDVYDATAPTFDYTFSTSSSDISGLPTGVEISFENVTYTNHQATKCVDVDLSSIIFANETPQQASITVAETPFSGYSVDSKTYTLLVDSRNTVDTNNNITGHVGTAYLQDSTGNKVMQFDFESARINSPQSISISKTVKGTAGDVNKLFKYTVNISGAAGDTYTVTGAGTGSASSCSANTDCVIYLKHGDSARIGYDGTSNEIPVGETYVVTEDSYSDYTTTVAVNTDPASTARTTGSQVVYPGSYALNTVSFVNEKNSSTPTGIFLNIWPYILLGVISLGAVIYTKKAYSQKK